MTQHQDFDIKHAVPWWQPMLFAAFAGGMAWGIRGQYGHETGAMIAGLLVSLTLVFLFCRDADKLTLARAVAWTTVAMGFGGTMTYGQTVGLTQDTPLVGNWEALRWGMLGLAIKGGIWIGFAGLFLGIGLGGVRYRVREMLTIMIGAVVLSYVGVALINSPYDPANKVLPWFYFSDSWHWEPVGDLKPRREVWGGLLLALLGITTYVTKVRNDGLARNMAGWGMLAGALGFPLGQSVQASFAWNNEFFHQGVLGSVTAYFNWWNMMETTFGTVMGAVLGLGLWLNRERIQPLADPGNKVLWPGLEWSLVALHVFLLTNQEFLGIKAIGEIYDPGLVLGFLPIVVIAGGRWWPFLQIFPITLIPIAGKTLRALAFQSESINLYAGCLIYFVAPLGVALAAALWFSRDPLPQRVRSRFVAIALMINTWTYFGLNHAFFHFPWPWREWTGRTPNGLIFSFYALGLTALVIAMKRRPAKNASQESL